MQARARMQRIQSLAWGLVRYPAFKARLWAEIRLHALGWLIATSLLYWLLPVQLPRQWWAGLALLALLVSAALIRWRFRKDDWRCLQEELALSGISDMQALSALLAFARQETALNEDQMRNWLRRAWASFYNPRTPERDHV